MSALTFPTRPGRTFRGRPPAPGLPRRARPCRCELPLRVVGEDTCLLCGHLDVTVIDATFAERARLIASRSHRHLSAAA